MDNNIINQYKSAQKKYAELGVDTEIAIKELSQIPISIHCWQGDDVGGFEKPGAKLSGGGILVTGNYPGKARSIMELQIDLEKALSLIPGKHRVNLHSIYGDFEGKELERNEYSPEHYQKWIDWAKSNELKLDFNSTLFSHPNARDGFTLSSKKKEIREYWIEHVRKCREISAEIGKQLKEPCIHNIWIPDGYKDLPIDKRGHRNLLKESLDTILTKKYSKSYLKDSLESKLFGIGSESFVVGSHDFYLSYAISNQIMLTMDTGHFHPTESIADKISAILPFLSEILLHLSRGVRWDSDHVIIVNDDLTQLAEEVIKNRQKGQIHLALDYFDATINRIGAWVIGTRAIQKALLRALLLPLDFLRDYEESQRYFNRLALLEEIKLYPIEAVWDFFCLQQKVPTEKEWISEIEKYEKEILLKRN